jgi:hypothetical protein
LSREALREVVIQQAAARARGDEAGYASHLTPQAVLQLSGGAHGSPLLPRVTGYQVLDVNDHGNGTGESSVRFTGRGSYVIVTRWRNVDGTWRGVEAEVPAGEMKASWWQKVFGRGPRPADPVERKDLS